MSRNILKLIALGFYLTCLQVIAMPALAESKTLKLHAQKPQGLMSNTVSAVGGIPRHERSYRVASSNMDFIFSITQGRVLTIDYVLAYALRQAAGGVPTMRLNARENAASES